MSDAQRLLAAGAVLPPGTEGAGENAVPLTARTYRHPGLDDRVVVRLAPAELGEAEDLAANFLGLEIAEEPEVIGVGRRISMGFPEWVLAHHPDDGHHALAVVPELERIAERAKSKPAAAAAAFVELAGRLASSVPHLLPTFYERVAREFLAAESTTYAAQMFTRARDAEAEHGLPIDEERHDAVFLEFALAGVLQVKTLSAYAGGMSARVPAAEALRRFSRMCVRRTAGGVVPSVRTTTDLRRLAKAAGENVQAVEQEYLAEVLIFPATARAAANWWKTHRTALIALARTRPEIRGRLLNLIPQARDDSSLPALWLEILEKSGAATGLCDPESVPVEARPEDGTLGWLKRFQEFWAIRRHLVPTPALYPLVERLADRLKTELETLGEGYPAPGQIDLLDLLLARGVPVADPDDRHSMSLEIWIRGEEPRDLLALAADPRFRASFHRNADVLARGGYAPSCFQRLIDSPGGRSMLADWVATIARKAIVPGLLAQPGGLERLERIPGPVLALAEDEVRAATGADLAPILARALRAGIFAELGWPAWEEALAELGVEHRYGTTIADAWPYLIVGNSTQIRVIGVEGTVLVHDLLIPLGDKDPGSPALVRYADGELLVCWRSSRRNDWRGYRHGSADRVLPMADQMSGLAPLRWFRIDTGRTAAPPGGGHATGAGLPGPGAAVLPESRRIFSDGTSYWAWLIGADGQTDWYEYDPKNREIGRRGGPAFFTDATRDLPEGSTLVDGVLRPAPTEGPSPAGVPVDGLEGWRVVRLPDGSHRGEDLAGNTITTPPGVFPSFALFMPGDDRLRAFHVTFSADFGEVELIDPDGVVTARARTDRMRKESSREAIMPPVLYRHALRPRDPRGSRALRRIDRDAAAALIKAAQACRTSDDLAEAVRAIVPDLTHEDVIVGVAETARLAARRQGALNGIVRKLEGALAPEPEPEREVFPGPSDAAIRRVLSGNYQGVYFDEKVKTFSTLLELMRRAKEGWFPAQPSDLHISGIVLPYVPFAPHDLLAARASLAYRAVSALTLSEGRETLSALLRTFGELGMTGDGEVRARWRRLRLRLPATIVDELQGRPAWRTLLPLEGGAFLAFLNHVKAAADLEFSVLLHDPAGRFEVPSRYEVVSSEPLTAPEDSFSPAGLLAEAAERGPAPWFPEAAEELARLAGVTVTMAKLILAALPKIGSRERDLLPPEAKVALGLKVAEAVIAKERLRSLDGGFAHALVGALVPAEPSRLWTDGPDVAAAAEVWIAEFGRRMAVPEALEAEAAKSVNTRWGAAKALPALLDPAFDPRLSRDLKWVVSGNRILPEDEKERGLTADVLVGSVATAAWLAHRLPAGDPMRERLPAALEAVRERLANPDLMLHLPWYVDPSDFRRLAGPPSEVTPEYERFGAVIVPTGGHRTLPAVKASLLDEAGEDPFLSVLRGGSAAPTGLETALRLTRDERFAALLSDPGGPVAGERNADGTWWPQDPTRSVPDLVCEVADRYGLSPDAAVVYLMLLAMPDPTDRNTAGWTGWKPARLKAARAELAETDLVVEARRARASRSLFLPGGWAVPGTPHPPQEEWKLPLYDLFGGAEHKALIGVLVPAEPVADLYRRAWRRVLEGDVPRFVDLEVRRGRRR
ncbi:DNA-binding protein [Actinocorallia sp. B10E7]|uniref:DNA-binding protein n=1 Tax=Actinocorallia sp. B10E7 TaxID=3153558 RepID=UPI00325DE721